MTKFFCAIFLLLFSSNVDAQDISPLSLELEWGLYRKEDQFKGNAPQLILRKRYNHYNVGLLAGLRYKAYNTLDGLPKPGEQSNILGHEAGKELSGLSGLKGNYSEKDSRFYQNHVHLLLGYTFFPSKRFNFSIVAAPGFEYIDALYCHIVLTKQIISKVDPSDRKNISLYYYNIVRGYWFSTIFRMVGHYKLSDKYGLNFALAHTEGFNQEVQYQNANIGLTIRL